MLSTRYEDYTGLCASRPFVMHQMLSRTPLVGTGEANRHENPELQLVEEGEHYSEKITLDKISKSVLSDKYTLCREFKKITGKSVVEYVNIYRCQKAAEQISEGESVFVAARNSGFNNMSFFTKTFKRYMGVLPSKFRL